MIHNRIPILICGFALVAGITAAAQVPPAPPAPPAAPAAPLPPAPPAPPTAVFDFPFGGDFGPELDAKLAEVDAQIAQADAKLQGVFGPDFDAKMAEVNSKVAAKMAQVNAKLQTDLAFFQRGRGVGIGRGAFGNTRDDRIYESGQNSLDNSQWNAALASFTQVAANGGSRADGALYWKAYTLNKLGRRDEAMAAIAELRKSYASSRWLDDANALEIEVKQAAGQNVSPEAQTDEELKLMALNALVNSDPDRAFPLLENLLKSSQSLRLKERALFVLAQNSAPRAHQLLEQVARGNGNPDLQLKAIQYLGTTGRRQGGGQTLFEIYGSTSDDNIKRALLRALLMAGDTDHLMQVVKTEKSPELRAQGIRYLSSKVETGDSLVTLWATEQDQQVKRAILDSLNGQQNAKALVDLARKERDTEMKREIVRRLSNMKSKEATDYWLELLK